MLIGKPVTVQAPSLQDALEKAAQLLSTTPDSLVYELLAGREGSGSCRIEALCVAPPPSEDPANDPLALIDRLVPPWTLEELAGLSSKEFLSRLDAEAQGNVPHAADAVAPLRKGETFREITKSVTAAAGPIDHHGDLVIRGNAAYGAIVKATGSITVDGDVEGAFVECANLLDIKGGILGTVRSRLGTVSGLYAHGAYIAAGQRIVVAQSALHSRLTAGTDIEVGDAIIGGLCYAYNILRAGSAGSQTGATTRLAAGHNRHIRERLEQIRRLALRLTARLSECEKSLQELEPAERNGSALSPEKRIALWRAVAHKRRVNSLLVALSGEKTRLIGRIDQQKSSRIKVRDRIYPHTMLEIDDNSLEVRSLTHYATYSKDYESGGLRMSPYS